MADPIHATFDEAVQAAGALLKTKEGTAAQRFERAALMLVRSIRPDDVVPEVPLVLKGRVTAADVEPGVEPARFGYVIPLDGSNGPGYVAFFLNNAQVHIYRVLKYKSAAEGGNDYAVIDTYIPPVLI